MFSLFLVGVLVVLLLAGEHERTDGCYTIRWHMPWGTDQIQIRWPH